jgi:hypothetical protein
MTGQTTALLHWFRRPRIRREIRDDIHQAFMPSPPHHLPVTPHPLIIC